MQVLMKLGTYNEVSDVPQKMKKSFYLNNVGVINTGNGIKRYNVSSLLDF